MAPAMGMKRSAARAGPHPPNEDELALLRQSEVRTSLTGDPVPGQDPQWKAVAPSGDKGDCRDSLPGLGGLRSWDAIGAARPCICRVALAPLTFGEDGNERSLTQPVRGNA